jgi:hypothetical protein
MQNEFRINGNPNLVGTFPKELKNWKKITTIYVTYNGLN